MLKIQTSVVVVIPFDGFPRKGERVGDPVDPSDGRLTVLYISRCCLLTEPEPKMRQLRVNPTKVPLKEVFMWERSILLQHPSMFLFKPPGPSALVYI